MVGIGLIIVGFTPLLSFLPLFMRQVVGLSESNVVRLPMGAVAGGWWLAIFGAGRRIPLLAANR